MDFCVIAPVGGLERYARLSKRHLVLAQIDNPLYVKFYQERKAAGDFIILDNGAYELGAPAEEAMLRGIDLYSPDVVVLPDLYLGDAMDSLEAGFAFQAKHIGLALQKGFKWMFVPQAKPGDQNGWIRNLNWALSRIKPDWIGLSRNMVSDKRGTVFSSPLARIEMCRKLTSESSVKIHALGMQAGCLAELWALHHAGCTSLDNSSPVWRGWYGYGLEESNWPDFPVNFDDPMVGEVPVTIDANLRKVALYANTGWFAPTPQRAAVARS